jgi:hypothetical protein
MFLTPATGRLFKALSFDSFEQLIDAHPADAER